MEKIRVLLEFQESNRLSTLKFSQSKKMLWKNGGGTTNEFAIFPIGCSLDQLDWRISSAEMSVDSEFSLFPHCRRILVPIAGNGIHLTSESTLFCSLNNFDIFEFSGAEKFYGKLIDGPIRDFNFIFNPKKIAITSEIICLSLGQELELMAKDFSFLFFAQGAIGGDEFSQWDCLTSSEPRKRIIAKIDSVFIRLRIASK